MPSTELRPIPDERDQISRPEPRRTPGGGCLYCPEHAEHYKLLHALHRRVVELEQQVAALERRVKSYQGGKPT